jgi:hypothetical protein
MSHVPQRRSRSAVHRTLLLTALLLVRGEQTAVACDEPEIRSPADYTSDHFLLHTDLPVAEAELLLQRLETMQSLIGRYWNASTKKVTECYVIQDLANWPESSFAPEIRAQVQIGGVTRARGVRVGRQQDLLAVVYAMAQFGTPQHEAVHAFCYHAFGRTGPTWYAEGMAELGTYWVEGETTVNCPQYVVDYLQASPRPSLADITDPDQETGDGWKNYAWRWALCHFMVHNPNYQDRFRTLGLTLLSGRGSAFESAFSSQRKELEFEFAFFLDHLQRGFDVGRCRWDWKRTARPLRSGRSTESTIAADRGWQPSGVKVVKDQQYVADVSGEWQTAPVADSPNASDESTGNSDTAGEPSRNSVAAGAGESIAAGTLTGCILADDVLSEEFAIRPDEPFIPPAGGALYLRCFDSWTELGDNTGERVVRIRLESPPE